MKENREWADDPSGFEAVPKGLGMGWDIRGQVKALETGQGQGNEPLHEPPAHVPSGSLMHAMHFLKYKGPKVMYVPFSSSIDYNPILPDTLALKVAKPSWEYFLNTPKHPQELPSLTKCSVKIQIPLENMSKRLKHLLSATRSATQLLGEWHVMWPSCGHLVKKGHIYAHDSKKQCCLESMGKVAMPMLNGWCPTHVGCVLQVAQTWLWKVRRIRSGEVFWNWLQLVHCAYLQLCPGHFRQRLLIEFPEGP